MGRIRDDMARLVEDIYALRRERQAYVQGLRASVGQLCRQFRAENAERARRVRAQLKEGMQDLLAAREVWYGMLPFGKEAGRSKTAVAVPTPGEAGQAGGRKRKHE